MKFLLIVVFAVLGYVGANCGCLKCSKHLNVVGELPGAPGQVPIKLIYRYDGNNPAASDSYFPVQQFTVQTPLPKPGPIPLCSGGNKYPIFLRPFYKPVCSEGCYTGSGAIVGKGAAGNPCGPAQENAYDFLDYYGNLVPVTVQTPLVIPKIDLKTCAKLDGLKTAVDRVILPAPVSDAVTAYGSSYPGNSYSGAYYGNGNGCGGDYHQYSGCGGDYGNQYSSCSCQNRYGHQKLNPFLKVFNFETENVHKRSKRQILQHGYKFIVNMLPPFIQEPIKSTVNKMAITHPDKKLRQVYNLPPPPLTLKEKIELKHKENVEAIRNKLYGTTNKKKNTEPLKQNYKKNIEYGPIKKKYKYSNKYVDDLDVQEEIDNFIDSLQAPELKKKSFLRNRSKNQPNQSYSWNKEKKSSEILGKYFSTKPKNQRMTEKEKAYFLQKLEKLNQNNNRNKRDTSNSKSKRSITIGSDELNLPLYQIKVKNTDRENKLDNSDSDYDYDYDYDDDDNDDERVEMDSFDAAKEEFIRNAIREELQKFRQIQSEEELEGDPISLIQSDKIGSKFPLLRILTFPAKLLKGMKSKDAFPIVGDVPKILVGTKNYIRDFGRNFKRNFLHFASDIIGDFDHNGSTDNILANVLKANRLKRSLVTKNEDNLGNFHKDSKTQNFCKVFTAKVRKKRYILKTLDDDEIEELLRHKLGKLLDDPQKNYKRKRKNKFKPKIYGNSIENKDNYKKRSKKFSNSAERVGKKRRPKNKSTKNVDDNSNEDLRKKIIIEPIKPKVIIDNNGLPFMEVNGYKRPIFMKHLIKDKLTKKDSSTENSSFDPYDSSEEVNLQNIHNVIDNAKNRQNINSRSHEVPLDALKDKISQLLSDIDTLIHMDFEKYDDTYDNLIEIQSVKTSIVQSWKRLIMEKKINHYDSKIDLLEKFEYLQHLKTKTMQTIIYIMQEECENSFALRKIVQVLMALHKVQCIIDQVVSCFQEKFKTGSKFDIGKEIKFVDFLSSLRFVHAKTRNDMITSLKEERDKELQEYIDVLEKLEKLLIKGDESLIEKEANILWEMNHVQKMQLSTIEEMYERMDEGLKIKKNMKALFDLARRLRSLQEKQKKMYVEESNESTAEENEEKSSEDKTKVKKIDIEEFKIKWQDKVQKQKELMEETFKNRMLKLKELREKAKKNKSIKEEIDSEEYENE